MRFSRLVLIPAALMAVGCIQGQRVIKVNADGSGTIVDTVSLGAQARQMMAAMEEMDKAPAAEKKNKKAEKLKAMAASMGEGVSYVSQEPGKDGAEKITYAFKDISKLKVDWSPDPSESDSKAPKDPLTFRFVRQGGNSILTVVQPAKAAAKAEGKPKPKPEEMAQQMGMMKAMMAGLKMSGILEVNGRIVKTNSPYAAGPVVTLMEIDFDQLVADEASFKKLAEIDDPSTADPKVMAGIKGVKVHTQPEIVIEFAAR